MLKVLMAGVARGDRAAFERLYRETSPRLYGLCLRVVRRPELAEEILQEVYTQIWREAARHAPRVANPMGWMGMMVRNRAIDALRQRERELARDATVIDVGTDPNDDPSTLAQVVVDNSALRACLESLAPERREAISLAFFTGMSHRELSAAMGQPAGTVKSWIRRGLSQLRRCLES